MQRKEKRGEFLPRGEVAHLILRVLLGESPVLEIRGRRYRLEMDRVFRLEAVDGGFIFFMRTAGALQRRLTRLAGRPFMGAAGPRRSHLRSSGDN